ncbi:MGMT family protein [Acinetobacter puyangensis]|uniref:Methylated-DNA-protein-cysteine methyltransferase related protein n=1 Tax=Acinetobacter puyangensis TaxID=1096779 RepID=A0A240E4U8_9GAMM|nr:MGMT family protein [Acinetobacter puyangensis]SNX43788.1 methylated-DNA-protein-cysteine methyltransferase related protein [Acinetobacter puyangensis]
MQRIELARQILAVVDLIPYGRVASYGQVARLAGLPKHARMVAKVLQQLDDDSQIPWHRVINAQGQIRTTTVNAKGENIQKLMLLGEGVSFKNDKVELKYFEW